MASNGSENQENGGAGAPAGDPQYFEELFKRYAAFRVTSDEHASLRDGGRLSLTDLTQRAAFQAQKVKQRIEEKYSDDPRRRDRGLDFIDVTMGRISDPRNPVETKHHEYLAIVDKSRADDLQELNDYLDKNLVEIINNSETLRNEVLYSPKLGNLNKEGYDEATVSLHEKIIARKQVSDVWRNKEASDDQKTAALQIAIEEITQSIQEDYKDDKSMLKFMADLTQLDPEIAVKIYNRETARMQKEHMDKISGDIGGYLSSVVDRDRFGGAITGYLHKGYENYKRATQASEA